MKIADIIEESVVDGLGLRMVVFVQGCPHRCEGCHNPQTWDFEGGGQASVQSLCDIYRANPLLGGLTFSGGEPFCQPTELTQLARCAHADGLNIWVYTGFCLEQLEQMPDPEIQAFLAEIDVLIDGKYQKELHTGLVPFVGSTNQRIIDMKKTRQQGEVVLLDINQ